MPRRFPAILFYLAPGLLVVVGVLVWGRQIKRPVHHIPAWEGTWVEPGAQYPSFKSWRQEPDGTFVGECQNWPHKDRRADAYLRSAAGYAGDLTVELDAVFQRGRYLGCYLLYDPVFGNGYWLSTGHAVGEHPDEAYIKVVEDDKWTTLARAKVPLEPGKSHHLAYRRQGDSLTVLIDGVPVVTARDSRFSTGKVQLRLHNTTVAIKNLTVTGTLAEPAGAAGN